MVTLPSSDVRLEREISFDTSHRSSFQKDSSRDCGGRIREMSSRAVCNAVRVCACWSLVGCRTATGVNAGVDGGEADDALWVGALVAAFESKCAGDAVGTGPGPAEEWMKECDTDGWLRGTRRRQTESECHLRIGLEYHPRWLERTVHNELSVAVWPELSHGRTGNLCEKVNTTFLSVNP